ncbi:hypothetical protein [Paenibacillus antibioticophila]|uniref:hypothetical protein n=1 Tax=Paenibacillus antibioticophila TaxID=1274374 RepID=UPI0005C8404C|nr:hypothetical protein [Paenibacillus antibioticophila]
MGQQRIRKRRRRRFRKPDIVIFILSTITILLLFLWGGLYWKESSENKLIVNASEQEEFQQILLEDNDLLLLDVEDITAEAVEQNEELGEPGDASAKPGTQVQTNKDAQGLQTSTNQSTPSQALPDAQSTTKPDDSSTTKPDDSSTTKPDGSSTTDVASPSAVQLDSTANLIEKYEQEFTQLQEKCRKDMRAALSDAESSMQQLDKSDPRNVIAWRDQLNAELSTAESTCDDSFQRIVQNAENNAVSADVIEGWSQKYDDLKAKLQEESESKLQQLMGG